MKTWIAGGVLAVVMFGMFAWVVWPKGSQEEPETAPSPGYTAPPPATETPTESNTESPEKAAISVATKYVEAVNTASYESTKPPSIAPFTTREFAKDMAGSTTGSMQAEMERLRLVQSARITLTEAKVDDSNTVRVYVAFALVSQTKDGRYESKETTVVKVVKTKDGWRVADQDDPALWKGMFDGKS